MDVKPGSKSGAPSGMKPPSSDSNVNMSLASRIDQALGEEKNRREQLSRRPSYRKILKELGGSKPVNTSEQLAASDEDGEDGLSGEESTNGPANGNQPHKLAAGAKHATSSSPQQPSTGASVILLPHALGSTGNSHSPALRNTRSPNNGTQANSFEVHDAAAVGASSSGSSNMQLSSALVPSHHFVGLIPAGLNMMQMEGASQQLGTLLANAAQPAAILQYAQQGLDGQLYIPAAANMQAYQVTATSASAGFSVSNTQPLFVTTAPSGSTSAGSSNSPLGGPHGGGGDNSTRKREMRLLKNREAARECRRKKKEYVKCLENRVAVLESQNKTLIEELKALKELYCSKDAPTGSGQPPSAASVPQS